MSAVATNLPTSDKVTVPLNRSLRVTGAFYALYGLAALGKLVQSWPANPSAGSILAAAILGSFVLFGVILMLSVGTLRIDRSSYRYVLTSGVWPFVKRVEGPVSDVSAVRIVRTVEVQSDGEAAVTAPLSVSTLVIEWSTGRAPLELLRSSALSNNRFEDRAHDIANAFGHSVQS